MAVKTMLLLFLIAFPEKQQTRTKEKDLYTILWQDKLEKQWEMVEAAFIDCIVWADSSTFLSLWAFLEEPQKRLLVQNPHFFPLSETTVGKMLPLTAFVKIHSTNKKAKIKDCIIIVKELIRYNASWDGIKDADLPIINLWLDNEAINLLRTQNNKPL